MYVGIEYNKVLAISTDAAPYMVSAMGSLKIVFSKMIHLTCFSHGLHRMAEFIRSQFSNVNDLISKSKAVFIKVTASVQFKQLYCIANMNEIEFFFRHLLVGRCLKSYSRLCLCHQNR